ncbi:hypothetical protein KKB69_01930 [Patescibacteria group bacterium]|nr:hypothetical protein [Patescibacteria group bacterium]
MDQATTIENERLMQLQEDRKKEEGEENPIEKTVAAMSVGKKLSEHWLILSGALLFDLLAMIPFSAPLFNFIWGGVLYLNFGGKNIEKTVLTIGIGSIIDFFVGVLPVCFGATLVRIFTKEML